ncbi:BMP family ABC transporter substrate-binding protein [Undibacterium sp. Ren11W]|uniref:BMP family ABC transporter substrate-binding protein n=1 Tax=Undibacterium sp. Ren11W TaxID=3413045 RepID=UPI003BF0579C
MMMLFSGAAQRLTRLCCGVAGLQIVLQFFLCFLPAAPAAASENGKIIYVRPVPQNDDPYLQQGSNGIKQAAIMYQLQASTLESQANRAGRQQQLDNAVKQGAKIVVMIGYEFKELLETSARAAPQVHFIILEQCIPNPPANLTCITFRDAEVNYLAGMEAAMISANAHIGIIGAVKTPLKQKSSEAFYAGARAVNPAITLHNIVWIEGSQPFNDAARAETLAKNMLADGVDVIYTAAGGSNNGVFKALSGQTKARAIGNYVNQCPLAPGRILDNIQIHGDTAIFLAVGAILKGSAATKIDYGLKEGAVSLTGIGTDAAFSECEILRQRPVLQKLREASNAIIRGKLKIE